jgi:hypothetical protein
LEQTFIFAQEFDSAEKFTAIFRRKVTFWKTIEMMIPESFAFLAERLEEKDFLRATGKRFQQRAASYSTN